jgi:hypothetical protein
MNKLEYDIDIPMKCLIAMFTLLGCETRWCCCGFDYESQPMHKTHEYGNVFIIFHSTKRIKEIINALIIKEIVVNRGSKTDKWEYWEMGDAIYLRSDFDYYHEESKYPWSIKSCIHYPELSLIKIDELEKALVINFKGEFADEATLSDANKISKSIMKNWQYPILEDWIIKKSDIFNKE